MMAWTFFQGAGREEFRNGLGFDGATWVRARGWTLWKALTAVAPNGGESATNGAPQWGWRIHPRKVLTEVLADDIHSGRRPAR